MIAQQRWRLIFLGTFLTLVPALAPAQNSRVVNVWTARALATVLAEVGHDFEQTSGYRLQITSDLPTGFDKRYRAGEQFDLLITASAALEEWIGNGRVAQNTRTDISRSGIGVAVRAGASKPDLSTVEALQRALLSARSIAFLRLGSGIHFGRLIERLGIAGPINAKATRPDSDIVCELVARGEVELGVVVITQILTTPGVELAGPLPPGAQADVTFSAGLSGNARAREGALQLVTFLKSSKAREVMRRQGMEPATQ